MLKDATQVKVMAEPSSFIDDKFKIFTGSSSPELARRICQYLGVKPGEAKLGRFSDGEIYFQVLENVRGSDVRVSRIQAGWPGTWAAARR